MAYAYCYVEIIIFIYHYSESCFYANLPNFCSFGAIYKLFLHKIAIIIGLQANWQKFPLKKLIFKQFAKYFFCGIKSLYSMLQGFILFLT